MSYQRDSKLDSHQWFAPVTLQSKYEYLPFDTPPGSARDGEADARVLVRQPVRPAHRSEGQENRVSAVGHQGGERLDWGPAPLQKPVRYAGPGVGVGGKAEARLWTEGALYRTQSHCSQP